MPGTKVNVSTSKMTGIRVVTSDAELDAIVKTISSDKLLILYFFVPWCGSCQKINPAVDSLAEKYQHQNVVFFRVNAEKCTEYAKKHHVVRVPLFMLFHNRVRLDRVEGASPSELESKIKRGLGEIQFQNQQYIPSPPPIPLIPNFKMTDLTPYLNKQQCKCYNDLIPTSFQSFLEGKKLVSGKGLGRMILVYAFKEKMVITAMKVKAPIFSGPKVLRLFVNLHKVLDFAVVSQMASTQEITLGQEDLTGDHAKELRSGGLVGVENLQIYIPENMTKNRKTEIESLVLIGAPMSQTNFANIDAATMGAGSGPVGMVDVDPNLAGPSTKKTVDAYAYT